MRQRPQQEGNKPAVGALVSRRGPAAALPLPVPLPAPVAAILGIAFDTAKAVSQGLAGAAELAVHVAVSASIAATDVVMQALTNPIDAVAVTARRRRGGPPGRVVPDPLRR